MGGKRPSRLQVGLRHAHAEIHPTAAVEGVRDICGPGEIVHDDLIQGHIDAFRLTFLSSAGIALLGAIACFVLVRRTTKVAQGPIFSRRSRWVLANTGRTPAVTKHPPPAETP